MRQIYCDHDQRGGSMLKDDAPVWFRWFYELGQTVADLDPQEAEGRGLRIFVSVPTSEYSVFALSLGAMNASYVPRLRPDSGDMVASWIDHKCGEYFFQIISPTHANIGGSRVGYPGWPVAFVPDGTPENRTPRRIPKEERNALQAVSVGRPNAWYTWYASLCIHPVSIIGNKTNLLNQRDEIRTFSSTWLDSRAMQLLHTYSKQITNPNRFQFFPFSIFSPEITHTRKWLRQMEARLVVCESFNAYEQMHPEYQQLTPRVVLIDRRKDGSVRGNVLIRELQNSRNSIQINRIEAILRKAPPGVYTYLHWEDIREDTGDTQLSDLEIFEL